MHQSTPATVQAECLTAFARLRAGSPNDAFEIGEGCNFYAPSPHLGRHLAMLLHSLAAQGGLSRYCDPFNGGAKSAFAELTSARLGIPLAPQDITFVQGGTEAISLIISHLAASEHSLTLPIPNYYGFDQSAARWGAPVAAYYRHDGTTHPNSTRTAHRTALVEVLPNGVTGTLFTPPAGSPDFTLLDLVFQHGAHHEPPALEAAIQSRLHKLDLAHGAVIMTASKDLAMPGLRAGAIITRNRALRQHLAADAFDRAPAGSPLTTLLMVLYAALLHAANGPVELLDKRHRMAQQIVHDHGLPDLPEAATTHQVHTHLNAMARRFRTNSELLTGPTSPLAIADGLVPMAGYSAFPHLRLQKTDFLDWVRRCGVNGLRLNPTLLHAGTAAAWHALHPGQHLRVNLSESEARTASGLQRLRAELPPARP
ncbi:aminotransferase class I/II-fold pyridoxal phosphate-dependent enzyme [Streptomyces sp. BE20]|uniref:aminotransferase class I/II-fold pyridoxal phosphate-dependent enzyme n=1 Tax=Streptomyces sp. BE20 TaxID=3002525 RepID=UPI002E773DDD|nr:aminotransferase class I/II-fold pyridoxal phosphate-dependent enzyme [Streptomyces sp. BE20]MEE1823882.1 aminotransferase class I/II-fold pyridoxal phosphate-dependent enzyme [Streptomyces sp. BE20]